MHATITSERGCSWLWAVRTDTPVRFHKRQIDRCHSLLYVTAQRDRLGFCAATIREGQPIDVTGDSTGICGSLEMIVLQSAENSDSREGFGQLVAVFLQEARMHA